MKRKLAASFVWQGSTVSRRGNITGPGVWLIAFATVHPGITLIARAAQPQPPVRDQPALEELDEALIEGQRRIKDPEQVLAWMTRLPGRFIVDGSVDLYGGDGSANQLKVQGRSDCGGLFPTRAVQCELNLDWPDTKGPDGEALLGGVSTLKPAMLLYAYDNDPLRIRYMLVDSKGIAETAAGYLVPGGTMVSRDKCVHVPGHCERVVWVTAGADQKEVAMKIDLEVEYRKAVTFMFRMHRVPDSASASGPESK